MNLVFKHFCYQYFARKRAVYEHNPTKDENDKNLKIIVVWEITTTLTSSAPWACTAAAVGTPPTCPFPDLCITLNRIALWMGTSFLQKLCNNITGCKVLQLTFRCANKTFDTDPVFTMLSSQRVRGGMIYYHLVNSYNSIIKAIISGNSVFVGWSFFIFSPCSSLLPKMTSVSEATSDSSIKKSYTNIVFQRPNGHGGRKKVWFIQGSWSSWDFPHQDATSNPLRVVAPSGAPISVFFPTTIYQV